MKINILPGGNKKGKSILLISGVHGDEATPIYTLMKILQDPQLLDLKSIKTLTIINGINRSGIKAHDREMKDLNTMDLNRSLVIEEIDTIELLKTHINMNDVIIDIHSSPSCTEFALIDIDEYTISIKKWCDTSNVKTAFRYSSANTIKRYSLLKNKLSLTIEINKLDIIDIESANRAIVLLNNLISNVNTVKLKKSIPKVNELIEIKTYLDGIFLSDVNIENDIKKGDILGKIYDYNGKKLSTIKATLDGNIITYPDNCLISRGDILFYFQPKNKKN